MASISPALTPTGMTDGHIVVYGSQLEMLHLTSLFLSFSSAMSRLKFINKYRSPSWLVGWLDGWLVVVAFRFLSYCTVPFMMRNGMAEDR